MSVNQKRTHGRTGRQLAYAANTGTLGQVPQRHRRIDRPVDQEPAPGPQPFRADIARLLADAGHRSVPRRRLREAMPDLGREHSARLGRSGGQRASRKLGEALAEWESFGWVRRDLDADTVTVLDPAALRSYADQLVPPATSPTPDEPVARPPGLIARALADALAAGDREAATRLTGELQAAEDHDPDRLAVWARAVRSRLDGGGPR